MKKQLLKLKMLLVAAALCVGASAWADDYTSVYSRATVGEWTNDDITDWGGIRILVLIMIMVFILKQRNLVVPILQQNLLAFRKMQKLNMK